MTDNYKSEIKQIKKDVQELNLPPEETAMSIILSSEKYSEEEIKSSISDLDENIHNEFLVILSEFTQTKEYFLISSTGKTLDVSNTVARFFELYSECFAAKIALS